MPAKVERFIDSDQAPAVRGFLHRPPTHRAMDSFLPMEPAATVMRRSWCAGRGVCEAGLSVLRCDLPFRQAVRMGRREEAELKTGRDCAVQSTWFGNLLRVASFWAVNRTADAKPPWSQPRSRL